MSDRKKITADAIQTLTVSQPDALITGCPLCKKTFAQSAPVQVMDIAEVISKAMVRKDYFLDGKTIKVTTEAVRESVEV
jgi:Fe-S oxidoreductase